MLRLLLISAGLLLAGCASGDNACTHVDVIKFAPSAPVVKANVDAKRAENVNVPAEGTVDE